MNASRTMAVIVVVGILLGLSGSARGGWIEQDKLPASDGALLDELGGSVSIFADYVITGARGDDDKGSNSGSSYIFQRSGSAWNQQAKLTADDGASDDWFGTSVSISGAYAVVGARYDDDNGPDSGSAYIFKRSGSTWTQQAKLTPSNATAGDVFGYSVSINGDYAVVGSPDDDDGGLSSGSAYIFHRSGATWTEQAKLTASDPATGDMLGQSVSISGDYAIAGAYYDDDKGAESGSAYIFKRIATTWVQQAKLTASDGAEGDHFGESISISGDWAIVGATYDDDKGSNSGSAYIFKHDGAGTWNQVQKLTASDGVNGDLFAQSVSISGDYAVVGAMCDDDDGTSSGAAYLFQWTGATWTEIAKFTASDAAADDRFGKSVSISGKYAVVGAFGDDGSTGSAYVYAPEPASVVLLLLGVPFLMRRRRTRR